MQEVLIKYYHDYNRIIYHLIMLCGIVIGIIKYKPLSKSSRIFLLLLLLTPFIELTAFYCAVKFRNNSIIYNPFTIIQFFLVGFAFFTETKIKAVKIMMLLFLIFAVVNGIYFEPFFTSFNKNIFLLSSLFIIVWYFMYLVLYFKISDTNVLRQFPFFWIATAWMFFSIATIVSFGFIQVYTRGDFWDAVSTYSRQFSNYLLYLSFIIAFLMPQKSLHDITAGK
jgi:hypothetical protein